MIGERLNEDDFPDETSESDEEEAEIYTDQDVKSQPLLTKINVRVNDADDEG